MKLEKIIHILRNPYGFRENELKEARLDACDFIERITTNKGSIKNCVWNYESKYSLWTTSCQHAFAFEAGMRFCPYCGKAIEEVKKST